METQIDIERQKLIEKVILDTAIKLAAKGIGSISVYNIGKVIEYEDLFDKDVEPFDITEAPRRFEILSGVDGACIIDPNGYLLSYSAKILNTKVLRNMGTRHAAGYTASLDNNFVVVTSEEDHKCRIFKDGKLIMQIDPKEKEVQNKTSYAINFLESIGAGFLGVLGTTILVPTWGLTLIPGILIFGTAHNLGRFLINTFKDNKSSADNLT